MPRWAKENSSLRTPAIEHPPGALCDSNLTFQCQATNINLRLPYTGFIETCEDPLWIVDRFTNLITLQLDFLDVCEGYLYASWDEDELLMNTLSLLLTFDEMNTLQSTIWKTMRKFQDPNRPAGALKEIIITGLPRNDLSLWVVR